MVDKAMMGTKNFNQIDAYFIRNLRVSNQDSGDTLAHALNVNKAYLYYIENGNKNLSPEFFNKVLTYYGVTYDQSNDLFEEAYNLTIKAYEAVIFKNNSLLDDYESVFNKREKIYAYSRGFIFVDLIPAILNVIKDTESSIESLKLAGRYLALYDSNVAYIYGVIYGFANGIGYNLADSRKVLFNIYENYPNHYIEPSIKGMFYYELGRIKCEEKQYIDALKFYQASIESLQSIYCIERVNQLNIEIATVFLKLRLYEEAERKYLSLLDEANKEHFSRRICACLNNLSYLYLMQKRYGDCEKCVILAHKFGSMHNDLNYFLAYCAYKTKSKADARSIITKLIDGEDDRYTLRMLRLIQSFVNDNTSNIDKYFNIVKKELILTGDMIELSMVYEMVISYYAKKDTVKCADIVEQYLKLPKF